MQLSPPIETGNIPVSASVLIQAHLSSKTQTFLLDQSQPMGKSHPQAGRGIELPLGWIQAFSHFYELVLVVLSQAHRNQTHKRKLE